ncbi:MAG: zf-HC2 domain-containing protein [Kofleriaceae bacterium]|nr:zf-HC2 domain-containing protein [Kofleriaceae bacterium]
MLTCQQITEVVTDYLEGKMGLMDRVRFQMHLGMCKHCRAYLDQMKQTIMMVAVEGQQAAAPMPQDVHDALMQRFRDWKK